MSQIDAQIDEGALRLLIVESEDLNSDALRLARSPLDEVVERHRDRRGLSAGRRAALAGAGIAGVAVAFRSTPAVAAGADGDVMALQTAASLEALAVATYGTALTLPYIKDGNAVVKAFAMTTMGQHSQHMKAFNARLASLGAAQQMKPDPKYAPVVASKVPALKKGGPADVVDLAMLLEDVATSTYVQNIQSVTDPQVRLLFGTIAGVESQHLATLHAVSALLKGNLADQIKLPPDPAKLPTMTAEAAFPEAFKKTTLASPPSEGAVK